MNKFTMTFLFAVAALAAGVRADTVIGEVPDTLPGRGAGGMTGFMAGATGGPLGAIAGAGIGWLFGGEVQETTGLAGRAYRVRRTDGSEVVVRSPGRSWAAGERVRIVNNRLVPGDGAAEVARPVSFVMQQ